MLPQNQAVDKKVDYDNGHAERCSNLGAEPGRVDEGGDVLVDEAALVTLFTGRYTLPLFPWCEWADSVAELNPRAPGRGRQMQPDEPEPAKQEQAAQHHKEDEAEVNQDQKVGGQACIHGFD